MKATTLKNGLVSCAVALALVCGIGTVTPAFAAAVNCNNPVSQARACRALITISGLTFTAPITVDARGHGHVTNFQASVGGATARINNLTLDTDPAIIFSASASNFNPLNIPVLFTFAFATVFSTPLSGNIQANSSIGYTLTDGFPAGLGGASGVTLSDGPGTDPNHVLVASDLGVGLPVNKGVDVGPYVVDANPGGIPGTNAQSFPPGSATCGPFTPVAATSNCGPFAAANTFDGGPFVAMTAVLSFNLSAQDTAGFSGAVVENQVPEPASLLLLGSGLLGLVGGWRRYSPRA